MRMTRRTVTLLSFTLSSSALAFCGFFVAKADTKLFNRSNQVIIARDGNRSVFTMMNDFQGDVKDFARIVPIPVVPRREDIRIGDPSIVQKLDAYSAPRLVEYFDEDPCNPPVLKMPSAATASAETGASQQKARADALGVKIEAQYQVGEYDILILSAQQQSGLATFLRSEGYKLPAGADNMLGSYLKGGMKFFVVKVNLERFEKEAGGFLRPIVLSYESDKFMLPIRLGTLNSPGEQDLTLYLLSPEGRVETSNYRTAPIPSNKEVPLFVKNDFANFYRDLFKTAYRREGRSVALMEYAWDTGWCDPCAGIPLKPDELAQAGVFWQQQGGDISPKVAASMGIVPRPGSPAKPVYLTRLHVRYTAKTFQQDLYFKTTRNTENFQGRYILRHPFTGGAKCEAGRRYQQEIPRRTEQQAQTLANLTGWNISDIRRRIKQEQ